MDLWAHRPRLDGQHFDVVVIGGGINGVAIARQCALACKRTLIIEQNDFASGTTSRSTRIIHGGLRYLEHGEIPLVRESLRERQRLLTEKRHLVRPLTFLLALPDTRGFTRSAPALRLGLWLYRRLAGEVPNNTSLDQVRRFEQQLDRSAHWTVFPYEDAQCEFPERLVADWLVEASSAGAMVRNHTEMLEIVIREGRVTGLVLRDSLTGAESRVSATQVVNATGPWVDHICRRSNLHRPKPLIGGVRGSHIVLPRFAGAPEVAIYTEGPDRRPVFVIPWNNQVLVGTTEIPDHGDPAAATPSMLEIQYLLAALSSMFPSARFSSADVSYAFAGVRPLPYTPGRPPSAVTRKHLLHDHTAEGVAGLTSIIGGKLTTAAALARDCARHLGIDVEEPFGYSVTHANSADLNTLIAHWAENLSSETGLALNVTRSMAEWYGPSSPAVARLALKDPALQASLCEHSEHVLAEAVYSAQAEFAVGLGDILLRRVPVALSSHWSEACTHRAARAISKALNWAESETATQIEQFENERAAFLVRMPLPLKIEPAPLSDWTAQRAA